MTVRTQRRVTRLQASQNAVVALLKPAGGLRRKFERIVEPAGITWQQYNVLRILRGAGSEGLPTMLVRDRMIERAPGITRLIDRLEARGWVERAVSPRDRREKVCRITSRGQQLVSNLDSAIDSADKRAFAPLDARELETLTAMLVRLSGSGAA